MVVEIYFSLNCKLKSADKSFDAKVQDIIEQLKVFADYILEELWVNMDFHLFRRITIPHLNAISNILALNNPGLHFIKSKFDQLR